MRFLWSLIWWFLHQSAAVTGTKINSSDSVNGKEKASVDDWEKKLQAILHSLHTPSKCKSCLDNLATVQMVCTGGKSTHCTIENQATKMCSTSASVYSSVMISFLLTSDTICSIDWSKGQQQWVFKRKQIAHRRRLTTVTIKRSKSFANDKTTIELVHCRRIRNTGKHLQQLKCTDQTQQGQQYHPAAALTMLATLLFANHSRRYCSP